MFVCVCVYEMNFKQYCIAAVENILYCLYDTVSLQIDLLNKKGNVFTSHGLTVGWDRAFVYVLNL